MGEGEGVPEGEKAGGKGLRFYLIENSILCLQVEGLFYLTDKRPKKKIKIKGIEVKNEFINV